MWAFIRGGSSKHLATDRAIAGDPRSIEDADKPAYLEAMTNFLKPVKTFWRKLPFSGDEKPLVTVIELNGVIGDVGGPGRKGLSLARVESAIEAAFKPDGLTAVALAINSPGGSPVQSRLIHNAIRRQAAKKKDVPVLAFVEDVGASGGYILSIAADEIYADESSIIGSIGVIAASFGFQDAIAKLGVERRVHTAGESKSQLDPFKPENQADVDRLETILTDIHQQFIALVKERRGEKVKGDDNTFSGEFWTAEPAMELGLIDGIAHLGDFLPTRFGENVKVKRISPDKGSLLKRLLGGEAHGRRSLVEADDVLDVMRTRSYWARYGL
ncbi:MAG: S49 family peptidase [Pseudomonadota bacterium]